MNSSPLIAQIDALLPQTQCGKCGHPGCLPYAEAIAAGEAINKCPPGDQATVKALSHLLGRPLLPLADAATPAQLAFIREAECIGCTKCLQVCPTDAIIGAAKLMHTVLREDCSGCELCLPACPVDCIDLQLLAEPQAQQQRAKAAHFRRRYQARQGRLQVERQRLEQDRNRITTAMPAPPPNAQLSDKAMKIEAARRRVAQSKLARQLRDAPNDPELLAEQRRLQDSAQQLPRQQDSTSTTLQQAKSAASMSLARLNRARKAFGARPTPTQLQQLEALAEAADHAQQQLKQQSQQMAQQ